MTPHNRQFWIGSPHDVAKRLSIGFSEDTLARINRLTRMRNPCAGVVPIAHSRPIAGRECDDRQWLLRSMIDDASRAMEELCAGLEPAAAREILMETRLTAHAAPLRWIEQHNATREGVAQLLAEVRRQL